MMSVRSRPLVTTLLVASIAGGLLVTLFSFQSSSRDASWSMREEALSLRSKVAALARELSRQGDTCPSFHEQIRQAVLEELDMEAANPSDVTVITGLFDLGRGNITGAFQRSFQEYADRLKRGVLSLGFPTVLYTSKELYEQYYQKEVQALQKHHLVFKSNDELRREFKYFELTEKIRTDPKWIAQDEWLSRSVQGKLQLYNPMVMSKMYWMRDIAELNPFKTKYFLWIDGGHLCAGGLRPDRIGIFKQYMSSRFFATLYHRTPGNEAHGFSHKALDMYFNVSESDPPERHNLRLLWGGLFGGQKHAIGPAVEAYDRWLRRTLEDGYMGTEENALALAFHSNPELFRVWESGDHPCEIFNIAKGGCSRTYL